MNKNIIDDDDFEYEKEIADKNREIARQHEEAMQRAIQREKELEEQERKERDKRIANDKVELLRLKNGVVDEKDSSIQEVKEETVELHGKEKIANIWYHYKVWILFGLFVIVAAAITVKDSVSREKPDMTVMMIANNDLAGKQKQLEEYFEKYTPDFDDNGYVHVEVMMIPQSQDDLHHQGANNTKLVANLQLGEIIMVVTDDKTVDEIKDIMVDDLGKQLNDETHFDKLGYKLSNDKTKKQLDYPDMPDNVYISMRRPAKTTGDSLETMQKNYNKALKVMKNILKDSK